jgi:hypothetical protein
MPVRLTLLKPDIQDIGLMKHPLTPLLAALLAAFFLTACEVRIERPVPDVDPEEQATYARWPSLPVEYCIDESREGFVSNAEFADQVARAFAEWGVEARDRGPCDRPLDDGNNVNQIGWGRVEAFGGSGQNGGVYEAGVTRMRVTSRPGAGEGEPARLVEANIIIDPEPPPNFRNGDCLYTTILHEVGHFLGVGHLQQPAIMAPVKMGCPQDLTDADRQAIAELYNNRGGRW